MEVHHHRMPPPSLPQHSKIFPLLQITKQPRRGQRREFSRQRTTTQYSKGKEFSFVRDKCTNQRFSVQKGCKHVSAGSFFLVSGPKYKLITCMQEITN